MRKEQQDKICAEKLVPSQFQPLEVNADSPYHGAFSPLSPLFSTSCVSSVSESLNP